MVTPHPSPLPKGKGSDSEPVVSSSAIRWGRTNNTKTDTAELEVWSVEEAAAGRGTQVVRSTVPRAAAQHATIVAA